MKRVLILVLLFAAAAAVSAQTLSFGFGDAELETSLNSMNASAKIDGGGFTADVSLQWGVSATQVKMVLAQGLQPAEVYVAASFANLSGKSIEFVVAAYKKDKKAGWGALAKSLGIKPGSPAFKALKDKSKKSAEKGKVKKSDGGSGGAAGGKKK
ncbi:MAG: hypothetical protein WCT14_05315 [Treponemataceae bacterium]